MYKNVGRRDTFPRRAAASCLVWEDKLGGVLSAPCCRSNRLVRRTECMRRKEDETHFIGLCREWRGKVGVQWSVSVLSLPSLEQTFRSNGCIRIKDGETHFINLCLVWRGKVGGVISSTLALT